MGYVFLGGKPSGVKSPGFIAPTPAAPDVPAVVDCNVECPEGVSRPYYGGPYIEYQTVQVSAATNTVSHDIPLSFSKPYKFIGVASIPNAFKGSSVWMHFQPLNIGPFSAGGAYIPVGTEQWFPLADLESDTAAGTAEGRYVLFNDNAPCQFMFVDIDHPNGSPGGTFPVTFFGTNDIDEAILTRT